MDRRRRVRHRLVRWMWGALAGGAVLFLALAWMFTRSQAGADLVLRLGLPVVERLFDGNVRVDAIRSGGLLRGLKLVGVEVTDPEGEPAIRTDSVEAAYRIGDLVRGRIFLSRARLWGAVVHVTQLPGQDRVNLERIFDPGGGAPGPSGGEGGGGGVQVRIDEAEIHGADLVVRVPTAPDTDSTGAVLEAAPGGGLLRRIEVTGVQGRVADARIKVRGQDGESARLLDLSARVRLFPEPVEISGVSGDARRQGATARLDATGLQLASSSFAGRIEVGWAGDGLDYDVDVTSTRFDPGDFRFFDPRLPDGVGSGAIQAVSRDGRATFTLADMDLALGTGGVRGNLTVHVADAVTLEDGDLVARTLDLSVFDPWTGGVADAVLEVDGPVRMDGPLERLAVAGRVQIVSPENRFRPSTVQVDGSLRLVEPMGASSLAFDAAPLDLELVRLFWAEMPLEGGGRARGTLDGSFRGALSVDASLAHEAQPGDTTRARYRGGVNAGASVLALDGTVELEPLHLATLAPVNSMFAVDETAAGRLELTGPLDDLQVTADLDGSLGRASGTARVDGTDLASGYRVEAFMEDFRPGPLVPQLGPSVLTGLLQVDLAGLEPEALRGTVATALGPSALGELAVDTAGAWLRFADGYAAVDSARLEVAAGQVDASGTLGLDSGGAPGTVEARIRLPDLAGVWERWVDAPQGDPADPVAAVEEGAPPVEGALSARVRLDVAGDRLDARGQAVLRALEVGGFRTDSVSVPFQGQDLLGPERVFTADVDLGALRTPGADLDSAAVVLEHADGVTRFDAGAAAGDSVSHRALGDLSLADTSSLRLDSLRMRRGSLMSALVAPATVRWGAWGLDVDRLEVADLGDGSGRLTLEGSVPTDGTVDLELTLAEVSLALVSHVAPAGPPMDGVADGRLRFSGPSSAPVLDGRIDVEGLSVRDRPLGRAGMDLAYRDLAGDLTLTLETEGRQTLDARLTVPLDLSVDDQTDRLGSGPISGRIQARDLPASALLTLPGVLEQVEGTVSGEVVLSGTLSAPRAAGTFQVDSTSVLLPDFGIRPAFDGALALSEDGQVDVDLAGGNGGPARVAGTVGLEDPLNPTFALDVTVDTFVALDRRDVQTRLSGTVRLEGDWAIPVVTGSLTADNTTLNMDELARSRQVADVTVADFYTVVDTTIFEREFAATPSFVDRSSIDLDLTLGSGSWLRSRDMNAEMEGRFRIVHPPGGEYALDGALRTIRGSYSGFGRTFNVVEGTVLFTGSRSFDPVLNIVTVTRVRSSDQALDIFATLQGTATAPEVVLSSNAQPPMAEEELVSYLVFGRPSYQLGSGENAVVNGVTGAASSMALGIVANELGAALGSSIGMFDYFTISAPQESMQYGQGEAMRSSIASTQVEFGQYLSDNLFVAAIFRPLDSSNQFAGGRLEWRFSDGTTLEIFLEDRLARSPSATFGDLGFTLEQSLGMFLAREWTY